ncbi:glutamate receptor-like isoform X2 [Mizuhopecten yessoensis]|uniref:glutamate receptor-like isoform X2 n=1 Tax=Mizuhopecten yessoensis TaxID=6573 RepID=UPI000B45E497|nr:glutamate receptor-like isoform X2 [Mizuhopecten yessoensis]
MRSCSVISYMLYLFFGTVLLKTTSASRTYNISALFDPRAEELRNEFEMEIKRIQVDDRPGTYLDPKFRELDITDSFEVSNAICEQLENGVLAFVGMSKVCALSTIQSYSDTFKAPFITLSMPQNSTSADPYQLYMRPHYIDGLVDVIVNYGWKELFYIYDTDEGLIRLQQLFQAFNVREYELIDINVKRVRDAHESYMLLRDIYGTVKDTNLRILLDITTDEARTLIMNVRNDRDMINNRFHFLLADLDINDMGDEPLRSGINVTGFQLNATEDGPAKSKDRDIYANILNKKITLEKALVLDAVRLIHKASKKLNPDLYDQGLTGMKCRVGDANVRRVPGKTFMRALRNTTYNGFTGTVQFDDRGFRKKFKLPLIQTTMNMERAKVGEYTREGGLTQHDPKVVPHINIKNAPQNETKIVTTVLDPPYVMIKNDALKDPEAHMSREVRCGKHKFEGFCIDLAAKIAEYVNFTYDICLVNDLHYGTMLENGTWNGMIGELTRREADLAIAPITISSARERVVDFTKPFMSLGISIMIKKPSNAKAHVFSFMDPLSYEIWMCILFAYVGVSVVLFLVSRFSPTEWHVEDDSSITNDFTISNSLWYSLGAFMQQGCDISPKAISGRVVGSVWWFFTLIIISSYTANLAAFLTVERMNTPIESAEDLAKQTNIQYGVLNAGTTKDFFKYSKVAIYERMWAYMTSANPSVFVNNNTAGIGRVRSSNGKYAYLVESTMNEYTNMRKPCDTMKVGTNLDSKGYGIATPVGSPLRDRLTLAVLHFRESGELQQLKKKWWDDRSECPSPGTASDGGQTALTLNNVAGIFYILISGLTLAILIAGCEFIYKSVVDSKKSKYTYTGPTQLPGFDPYPDTNNTHTQV